MDIKYCRVPEMIRGLTAKMNNEKSEWLPLWIHSTDTCGVAQLLLKEWMSETARRSLAGGMTDEAVNTLVCVTAFLHDIGKATALFQTRITKNCMPLRDNLKRAGLEALKESQIQLLTGRPFPHAAAGEALLLMEGCPCSVAEVIGAHHGQPWSEGRMLEDELQADGTWLDVRSASLWGSEEQKEAWRAVQKECIRWMLSACGQDSLRTLPEISQTTAVLLTGLIIMADWIASNTDYFPLLSFEDQDAGNMEERLRNGWKAVSLPGAWKPVKGLDSGSLCMTQFGFEANSVQKAMMDAAAKSNSPGLMILEAPMGIGKTEAALLAANILAERGAGGIFFGLPTQATANALFDRIVDWRRTQPDPNQYSIRLAHGMADLNAGYQALLKGNEASDIGRDEAEEDRLVAHEWFRGRKQSLLADFVVGTVDQVLMSALRQKHVMLRHLGLCGKTVIIDECHAYDAYMNEYLETALRWLGSYHTPVILLSATLPRQKRADFLAAYLNKSTRARRKLEKEEWYGRGAYPVLTWTDENRVCQQTINNPSEDRLISIRRLGETDSPESQAEEVSGLLTDLLKEGGCAAVVLNTVKRAQLFADVIRKSMTDAHVILLHSRYVMQDRLRHEIDLLKRMGKQSGERERNKVVVIGTQVIEQSLDFDADVMISDLCPMDLLLQRIGRLHRHKSHDAIRPEKLKDPSCYILCAGESLDYGASRIYGEYLLLRTRELLPACVAIPGDISRLVNEVYDDAFPLPAEPEGYEEARLQERQKKSRMKQDAEPFCINDPYGDYNRLLEGRIPDDEDHAQAQVRAGEKGMDVLILIRKESGEYSLLPWLDTTSAWSEEVCPDQQDCRKLLAQKTSLPAGLLRILLRDSSWDELKVRFELPAVWKSAPLLKGMRLLILNTDLKASVGQVQMIYSEDKGLEWKKVIMDE